MTIAPSGAVNVATNLVVTASTKIDAGNFTGFSATTGSDLNGSNGVDGTGGNSDPDNPTIGGVGVVGLGGTGGVAASAAPTG